MMILYRLLFIPGLLIGLPYYTYRMWRRGGYSKGFSNRFGLIYNLPPKRKGVKRIWIQAVSVGELLAIRPLLKELNGQPQIEVILTTTTSTGLRVLEQSLAQLVAWHGVFPLDFWPFSSRAWKRIQPDLAVLLEGELWPEHLHQAHKRSVPTLLVNGRMSDRSYKRHSKFRWMGKHYFRNLSVILASSETDQERFNYLNWIDPEKIILTGNLKLDVSLPDPPIRDNRTELLNEFGMPESTVLLLGSSTWPGEESALIQCYKQLAEAYPDLRLLLVPRHAERKNEIKENIGQHNVPHHFRSASRQAPVGTEVYIADTTGELGRLTNFADIVFIGKSLPPNTGGQTPVEGAAMGKPLIFGRDMSNFRDISRSLVDSGAAEKVDSTETLIAAVESLLRSPEKRLAMGTAARSVIEESRGATRRVIVQLKVFLNL